VELGKRNIDLKDITEIKEGRQSKAFTENEKLESLSFSIFT